MRKSLTGAGWLRLAGVAVVIAAVRAPAAGPNSWTNTDSSSWSMATNWSAAQAPSTDSDPVLITNAGTKTVTIDAATPALNLAIRGAVLSAPDGFTNTLLLTDVASATPFTTERLLLVGARGELRVVNSTLSLGDRLDIAGNVTLESGLIDSTPNFWDVRLGRSAGLTGTLDLKGGLVNCFGFRAGELGNSPGLCLIEGGTLLCSSVLSLGEILNAPGSLVLVSGQVIATNDITKVGNLAIGHWTQSGGSAQLAFLSIGDNAAGIMDISGGQVTVTPATDTDVTRVGNLSAGELNISGGTVWLRGRLEVADNPGVIGTVLLSGGQLIATNDLGAIGQYGVGAMTVTNAVAWFTNTSVGRHTDADGTLNVQDGGSVFFVDDLSIGRFTNAVGRVLVSGGLLALTNDTIWVGREGQGELSVASGTVRARNLYVGMSEDGTNAPQGTATIAGGTTVIRSNLVVGTSLLSTGQVSVLGGVLSVTNSAGAGLVSVVNGTFALSQGSVAADTLLVTNTDGHFSFAGGTLRARGMTVANGAPFVVGDGIASATLELQGGTYSFANGLVISPNATVTGCGTIVGTISNNGTLNTNCGPGIVIQSVIRTGTTAEVVFTTLSGATHVLEFKNDLGDPAWLAILPGIVGNGGSMSTTDPTATNATRFYRIHAQ